MAERNYNKQSEQNQNRQNNRQPFTQDNNRQPFKPYNRAPPTQSNQQPFKQDNRQPPRQNYEQAGRGQNNQQSYMGRNEQQRGGRNEYKQSGERIERQQDGTYKGQQQQYRGRNEQQGGGRNEQQDGRRNEGQDRRRNEYKQNERQQGGTCYRQEQQQYRGRNEQQDARRNNQQDARRNEQQDARRNEQQDARRNEQQDARRNEQPSGKRIEQERGEQKFQQQQRIERNEQRPQMETGAEPIIQNRESSHKVEEPLQQLRRPNPVKDFVSLSDDKLSKNAMLAIPRRADLNKAGTKGRRILVEANHLPMMFPPNMPIAIHYDVDIEPDKPRNLVIMAMEQFRKQNYPDRHPAYDGRKSLYSASPLPIKNGIRCEVKIMEDDRERTFNIVVKQVATIDLNVLREYFKVMCGERKMKLPEEAIHCLEVVLRSAASSGCTSIGQSFFTRPRTMMDLGEGMEMYSGIYQSAILGWKPFLNVDVAHKPFPKCLNITDVINEFCGNKLLPEGMKKVDKFLRNLKVRYEIPGDSSSKRISRVNQLDKNANEARFKNEHGIEMTVAEYYSKVKKYKLRHPEFPCLWIGNKQKRILYPVELCTLIENQVTNRTMTPIQTSKMIKYAATSTSVRKNKIMASVKASNYNNDKTVSEFGIKVDDKFVTIEARVLEPPKLQYLQSSVVPRRGVWRSDKFKTSKSITDWAILCTENRVREGQLQAFADKVIIQGKIVGMNIKRPSSINYIRLSYQRAQEELRKELNHLKGVELVLVVIPDDKSTYANVKRAAELQVGLMTQCIRSKNVCTLKDTTIANILLKVNAKLNGVNHCLFNTPQCLKKPCIIMGADVTHPSPESNGMVPSVAAVTASHDPKAFQYNISWRLQPPTQEIITDLANIVKDHLIFFYAKNKAKPERIIFFRDGVSEGQFQAVLQEEVMAIRKACLLLEKEGTYKPAITFIVVQKRHHTRLFPKNAQDSEDKNLNVPAGTVVDTTITHPTDLDFYMVSHASIQGVARPTKYRKLWDDFGMHEDELQELTYHLCHMFTRCNRSVSYPAPTYYAHLAASRAKIYCEGMNLNMNDDLEAAQKKLQTKKEIISDLPMYFV